MAKKHSIGARLLETWLYVHGLMPLAYHHFWAGVLAWLLGDVLHYRSHVVLVNLSRSFPEKSYEEIAQIRKRFYRHLANIFVESVWFSACRGEWGRKRFHKSHILEFTNPEEWNRLSRDRQLMALQAHTGNWELMGGIGESAYTEPLNTTAEQIAVVYLNFRSRAWNQAMEWARTAPVSDTRFKGYVEAGDVLRFVLENRHRQPFFYLFNTDQAPYRASGSLSLEFMHQPCRSMTGAAALACRLDMAAAYLRFDCRPEGGYALTVVPLSEHASETDAETLMRKYYQLLEEDLRRQPWNYLWTHRRWKTL